MCNDYTQDEFQINTGWQHLLKSASFPKDYPENMRCIWAFNTDPEGVISVRVMHMSLDFAGSDAVIFGEGDPPYQNQPTESAIIVRVTWGKKLVSLTSSTHRLWILFETDDDSRSSSGFYLEIRRVAEYDTGIILQFLVRNAIAILYHNHIQY